MHDHVDDAAVDVDGDDEDEAEDEDDDDDDVPRYTEICR